MRLRVPVVVLSILAGLGVASTAQAVYDWWEGDALVIPAELDTDNTYPYAGTVVFVAKEPGAYLLSGWPDVFTACSGSLIGQSLYLTARHCTGMFEMFTPYYDMYVTMDAEPMDGLGELRQGTKLLEVTEVIKAPDIDGQQIDLAVLQLKKPAKKSYPGIKQVGIASDGLLDELIADGNEWVLTYAGYGCTGVQEEWKDHPFPWSGSEWWDDQWFGSRYLGSMPLAWLSQCAEGDEPCPPPWAPYESAWWGEQFVMTYGPGNPAGYGDSGSPVFWENPANGKRIQVGVLKSTWWMPDENGVWYQEITSARVDHPLAQLFFDCVMGDEDERETCLDVLRARCGEGQVQNCEGVCTPAQWVGDLWCDAGFACDEFGNDGGDCDVCQPGEVIDCDGGCTLGGWVGDDWCDASLDCELWGNDGGDCDI